MPDLSFSAVVESALGSLLAWGGSAFVVFLAGIYWQKAASQWHDRLRIVVQRTGAVFLAVVVVAAAFVGMNMLVAASQDKAEGIKPRKLDSSLLSDDDRYEIDRCEIEAAVFAERGARNPRRASRHVALERFGRCVKASGFEAIECLGSDPRCYTFFEMGRRVWGDRL